MVVLSPVLAPFLGNIADAAPIGTETVTCFDAVLERAEKACAACFVPVFVEMIVALNAMMVLSWRRIDGYEEDWGPYRTREKMQGMYRSEMRRWFGSLNGRDEPLDVIPRRLDADLTAAENEGRDVDQLATMLCSYDPYRHVGRRRFVLASPGGDDARRRFAEHLRAKRSVLVRLDFLPCLKAGDSYSGWLNEALRFGGFPLHGRPRCDRLAPVSVLRRLHGRLTTP